MGCPIRAVFGNNDGEKVGLHNRFSALGHQVQERPWAYEYQGHRFLLLHEPVALDTLVGCAQYDLARRHIEILSLEPCSPASS